MDFSFRIFKLDVNDIIKKQSVPAFLIEGKNK